MKTLVNYKKKKEPKTSEKSVEIIPDPKDLPDLEKSKRLGKDARK